MTREFNATCNVKERRGISSYCRKAKMEGFCQFIEACNMVDIPCKGGIFSWFSGDGYTTSGDGFSGVV